MNTSSKTPSSATAKTAWALKVLCAAGVLYVWAVLLVAIAAVTHSGNAVLLRAAPQAYHLQVVTSPADMARGLGGRASLGSDAGMLFVFSGDATRCFWMKDMQFPLDIIWLDAHKRVVHIEYGLSPASYPQQYCPHADARYVLELNAGEALHAHITEGEVLTF